MIGRKNDFRKLGYKLRTIFCMLKKYPAYLSKHTSNFEKKNHFNDCKQKRMIYPAEKQFPALLRGIT